MNPNERNHDSKSRPTVTGIIKESNQKIDDIYRMADLLLASIRGQEPCGCPSDACREKEPSLLSILIDQNTKLEIIRALMGTMIETMG